MSQVRESIKALPYGLESRVYVAEFEGSLVKIGRSENLRSRLQGLFSFGPREYGVQMLRWSAFGPFTGKVPNKIEAVAIKRCAELFACLPGTREWFVDADATVILGVCEHAVWGSR